MSDSSRHNRAIGIPGISDRLGSESLIALRRNRRSRCPGIRTLLQLSETPPLEDVHIDEVELTAYDHLLDGEEEVVQC